MNLNKVFWCDVETTGTKPEKHDIIQLAYIIEIDREIADEGSFKCQPFNYATIEKSALEVNKTTIEDLKTYQRPQEMHQTILSILDKYVDKYNRQDKFIIGGYNVNFDLGMLEEFFKKNNYKYFWAYFDYHKLDPITMLFLLEYKGLIKLESHKLVDVCKYFGIEINVHNALSDIKATKELVYKLMGYLKEK